MYFVEMCSAQQKSETKTTQKQSVGNQASADSVI